MKNITTILFDLDGTLTDPKEGITKSIQYALAKVNINEPDLDKLAYFIGPPLKDSFMDVYQFTNEQADQVLSFYRERFSVKGLYENVVYDGIPSLLTDLKGANYKLAVATSKPTIFAKEILKYFKLDGFFDVIIGSELDGTRSLKADVITEVLKQLNIKDVTQCVMIGDRKHDVIGAKANQLQSIGVLYGYGSKEELELADANFIVKSVDELKSILKEI